MSIEIFFCSFLINFSSFGHIEYDLCNGMLRGPRYGIKEIFIPATAMF
jgi:hypothetical protein